jgi:hypothetical protein
MSRVNLADLASGRVPLAPRDAATLTLAVAREWDRQRELHGPTNLPHLAAIELNAAGTVAFLVVPPADRYRSDAAVLTQLLAQLLRINDRLRQPLPAELLIIVSGGPGPLDLPSATDDAFRSALAQFADDTPHALSSIYWRTVTAGLRASTQRQTPQVQTRPAPSRDRRATAAQVNELRRSIRKLEQHVFEWSQVPVPPSSPRPVTWATKRSTIAAAIGLLVSCSLTVLGILYVQGNPASAETVQSRTAPAPEPAVTAPAVATPARTVDIVGAGSAARRVSVSQRPQRARPRTVANVPDQTSRKRATAFAGGTRGIAWLAP